MRDADEISPVEATLPPSRLHRAVSVDDHVLAHAELVRADANQLLLELLRGVEGGATEHDRHAAADRRIARQAFKRVRPYHADAVGVDLQDLADRRSRPGFRGPDRMKWCGRS